MPSIPSDPILSLQSSDHIDLLNVIDELRAEGISHYVDLPQIIVCGDQSSGKSSVLEAVSGIAFPKKDNLCTRFATEVILRRNVSEYAKVDIIPGTGRTSEEKARLATFTKTDVDLTQLEGLIHEAKTIMGIGTDSRSFSSDILHIEISGPLQPHLTLVDLPGLFRAASRQQTDDDAEAVTSLVRAYMGKSRSIILAVVSAKNDFANQIVTKYAREFDPQGARTLGIITKPDTLFQGSDSEKSFVELAQNKDVAFRLGWHVVRNRDFDTRLSSGEERDQVEREFFQAGVWAHLPKKVVGISTLRDRLSLVLQKQILIELPQLLNDVEVGLQACKKTLGQLGTRRATLLEQRLYLHTVSERYTSIAKAAVEGSYTDVFFGDPHTAPGIAKRLRAVIQNSSLSFAETMRHEGHRRTIVALAEPSESDHNSRIVSRESFIEDVLPLMRNTRGRELPGTYSPHLIADLFFEQAERWEVLTRSFINRLWDQTNLAISLIFNDVADARTSQELLRRIVGPALSRIKSDLDDAITRILAPHQAGHPITYNHYFTDNLQKFRQKRRKEHLSQKLDDFFGTNIEEGRTFIEDRSFDVKSLLNSLTESPLSDMDRFACSEAIDGMMAYYKVAMKALVDAVAVLAVEECLLKGVPKLLSPSIVISLDDETIFAIAAESEDARAERARAEAEIEVLTKARAMLTRLTQTHPREGHTIQSLDSPTMVSRSPVDVAPLPQAAPQRSLSTVSTTVSDLSDNDRQHQDTLGGAARFSPRPSTRELELTDSRDDVPPEQLDWAPVASKKKRAKEKKLLSTF